MRPAGEIRLALADATQRLVREGRGFVNADGRLGVTWTMAAQQAQAQGHALGRTAARRTVVNMARDGVLERIGTVPVPGVSRPMTLYAPQQTPATSSERVLDTVLRTWCGPMAARRG